MTLKILQNKLGKLNNDIVLKQYECLEYGCEILLERLKDFIEFYKDEGAVIHDDYLHDPKIWINLRYLCRVGIRYCGQFVNTIIIDKDECKAAQNRIKLTFASYEGEDEFETCERYDHDTYFGDEGDKTGYLSILNDWDNFRNLIYSLMPFFKNTDTILKDKYTQACIDIDKFYSKETYKIKDKLSYLQEDIDKYFDKIFERFKNYNNKNKKHFLLLPDNLSLRYHGRFNNCLIKDYYSISLGFIKHQNFIAEEGYNQDDYTIENDLNRYNHEDYILLHETSLNVYHESYLETNRVLKDLIFLCGEDLQRIPEDNYLQSEKVKFIHTLLTD